MNAATNLLHATLSLFYPPTCEGCGANVAPRQYLCAECQGRLPRIVAPFCARCSEPFSGAIDTQFSCSNCADQTLYFDAAVSAYRARDIVRRLIHEFKYHQRLYLRHLLGEWLVAVLEDSRLTSQRFDMIIPV